MTTDANPIGPLTGITVLDLCGYLAGPYGCTLLGDLGASVIKVEPPGGDAMRRFPSTLAGEGESRGFVGVNRGKRSIVLDLKKPDGLGVLHKLVARADVLVENFRPDVPARLGIDYPALKAHNPALIYCALTGYGESGPLRDQPGFDQVLQTMTGIATFQGRVQDPDGPPQVVLGSIVDYYTAAMTALGITAALYHRQRTGEGQFLATSLLRSAIAMQAARFVWAEGEPRDVPRELAIGRTNGIHPTGDGFIYISSYTDPFWKALCDVLELPELATDPRYGSMRLRAEHGEELAARMRAALARKPAAEWERLLSGKVPCAMVRPIEAMFDHPQLLAEGLVTTVTHAKVGPYTTMTKPIQLSATPGPAVTPAPALGQHGDAILGELGFDAAGIAALRAGGAVG